MAKSAQIRNRGSYNKQLKVAIFPDDPIEGKRGVGDAFNEIRNLLKINMQSIYNTVRLRPVFTIRAYSLYIYLPI